MSYRKHLLNFDASRRSSTTIKTYSAKYEQQPFTGMIADASFVSDQISVAQPLANWNSSTYRIDRASLATAISDALSTTTRKYSEMYLITKMTTVTNYAMFDWWSEDRDTFVWNTGTMAGYFVSAAHWRGVFYDAEPNNTAGLHIWKYSDRPYASTKTIAEYKARVRETGRWLMEAWIAEGVKNVYLAFGYEQCTKEPLVAEADRRYGLYQSFLDGLFDAAKNSQCKIKNYFEDGYNHVDQEDIDYGTAQQRDDPDQGVAATKRLSYVRSYASYLDGLGASNITNALVRAHNTAIEDDQWVYANAQPFHGASGTPGVTAAEIAAVRSSRVQLGYERTFSPANWPGLIADFNPNLMAGLGYEDTDPIESYTDAQGIVYTQTGSNCPIYKPDGIASGKPGVLYTKASSQSLVCNAIAAALSTATQDKPIMVVAVIKPTVVNANEVYFGIGRDATTDPYYSFGCSSGGKQWWLIKDDAASSSTTASDVSLTAAAHVVTWIFSGTVINMRIDGVSSLTTPYATTDKGVTTFNQARIGCTAINTPASFAGFVCGRLLAYKLCHGLQVARDLELGLGTEAGLAVGGA